VIGFKTIIRLYYPTWSANPENPSLERSMTRSFGHSKFDISRLEGCIWDQNCGEWAVVESRRWCIRKSDVGFPYAALVTPLWP